jgi:hypothetical protein
MSVLVEDAAESIMSADVEVVELFRLGDRLGQRARWCRGAERPMRSVLVVERLVLAERVHQVGLIHDQGAVEEFGSARAHPAFHDRVHARMPTNSGR